jgi:hypothetical protein
MRAFLLFQSCQQQRAKKVLYWVGGSDWILGILCIVLMEKSSEIWRPIAVQKDLANGQCSRIWSVVSLGWPQASQSWLSVIFFLNRFALHWIHSLEASHMKNCTRGGAAFFQTKSAIGSEACCLDFRSL